MGDDFEISAPDSTSRSTPHGSTARSSRMTGGGFGGAAIALVPTDAVSRVQAVVASAFAEHGFATPEVFPARPSAGATREA